MIPSPLSSWNLSEFREFFRDTPPASHFRPVILLCIAASKVYESAPTTMASKKYHVRQAAVSALHAWAGGRDYAESLIERHAQRRQLSAADRGLLQAILYAVLRHRRLLDHWISKLRQGKLDPETRDILRVGLAQILLLGIPDHAAVNETVECGKASVRGLVNAVLRRAIDSRETLLGEVATLPPAVAHSHPDWLYKKWCAQFGKPEARALMEWNNRPADTFFRINPLAPPLETPPPGDPVHGAPGFFKLDGTPPVDLLAGGRIYIQDPATRHAVDLLAPQAGERVLDACAAPGGKAFLIAAALGNANTLVCTDSNEKRLPRLKENLTRLHAGSAEVACHNWLEPAPAAWLGAFDAILLDVPCSNTGVIRRRIDVRWRLQPADIEAVNATQQRILTHAAPCLKPGGRIVYSTCSIEREENEGLVESFVAGHPDFSHEATRAALPFRDGTDGAFAALLRHTP